MPNTVPINDSSTIQDKFVILGDHDRFRDLWKRAWNKGEAQDFWATLGRQDSGSITKAWSGNIVCSKEGNNSFTTRGQMIRQEAEQLAELYPELNPPDQKTVVEKFISLKDLRFTINDPRAKMMRFTLTLGPDEHAVVFLQHTGTEDLLSKDGLMQYLLPVREEITSNGKKLMTYFFEMPSQKSIDGEFQTIIKAICYKSPLSMKMTDDALKNKLTQEDKKYGILLFDAVANNFIELPDSDVSAKVKRDKKTLLLIHGTFSSTEGSYGYLYNSPSAPNDTNTAWLKDQVLSKRYEQIISFNHPTVVDSPMENAAKLVAMLAPGGAFKFPVDVITTSRGGLVGKSLVNAKQDVLVIDRVATVACANGVQWMSTGESIGRIVGYLRKSATEPVTKVALLLVQLGIDAFLRQPGLRIMKKDDGDLQALLKAMPANDNMRYLPLCGDYLYSGNHPAGWKYFDILLGLVMQDFHHDWVVETDYQVIMHEEFLAYKQPTSFYRSKPMDTTHLRYFYDPMNTLAKKRILYYLHDDSDVREFKTLPADF